MKEVTYHIDIAATAETIWHVLWDKDLYCEWTKPFDEGSRYEGSFDKEGDRIHFLSGSGQGMYSEVAEVVTHEYMCIRHLGIIDSDGRELPPTP